eukprot:scaffold1809_cov386-Prasinococcus_capsulatus_cf.AAC.26
MVRAAPRATRHTLRRAPIPLPSSLTESVRVKGISPYPESHPTGALPHPLTRAGTGARKISPYPGIHPSPRPRRAAPYPGRGGGSAVADNR